MLTKKEQQDDHERLDGLVTAFNELHTQVQAVLGPPTPPVDLEPLRTQMAELADQVAAMVRRVVAHPHPPAVPAPHPHDVDPRSARVEHDHADIDHLLSDHDDSIGALATRADETDSNTQQVADHLDDLRRVVLTVQTTALRTNAAHTAAESSAAGAIAALGARLGAFGQSETVRAIEARLLSLEALCGAFAETYAALGHGHPVAVPPEVDALSEAVAGLQREVLEGKTLLQQSVRGWTAQDAGMAAEIASLRAKLAAPPIFPHTHQFDTMLADGVWRCSVCGVAKEQGS